MTLGSKEDRNGKKIYVFELTEEEYQHLITEQTITKHVEWKRGRGRFLLKFLKRPVFEMA